MKILILAIITSILIRTIIAIEPISVGALIAAGFASGVGYKYFDKIKLTITCQLGECCNPAIIPKDIPSLHDKLTSKLFGQHLVLDQVFKAIASHYKNEDPRKPLVMTFHGTQGTGKNYVATMIAEAVFEKGVKSSYFHLFHGSQYEGATDVFKYRDEIRKEIIGSIEKCPYSIFVFDEVDKMPAKIFDSISAILDHHSTIRGKDFTKAIFIFLTNYGGEEITKILYQLVNYKGIFRDETKLHHFEEVLKLGIFNQDGGLQESSLIKSAVIDFYVPFLPLEIKHVTQCIKAEYENFGRSSVTEEMVKEIMNYIGFHKETKYAHTGCKTVYAKVQAECF